MRLRYHALAALLVFLALGQAACDSGDPIDAPGPEDVAAIYDFTALSFTPQAQAVQPVNLLDSLDLTDTNLRLGSSGNFILTYQFLGGGPFFLTGDFSVTEQTVRIEGRGEDRDDYRLLFLEEDFTLRRTAGLGTLSADIVKNVNLQEYDPDKYAGLTSVPGTLRLRLEPR